VEEPPRRTGVQLAIATQNDIVPAVLGDYARRQKATGQVWLEVFG
jgi:hypothetical protein